MTLERTLAELLGAPQVLVDPDLRAPYETDWTGRFRGAARCVARPADTGEVAAVLRACAAAGVAVTIQGGNTGLVGGGVPAGGDVLLSLTRLGDLGPVDASAGQVTVGAGATLEAVQRHVRPHGLEVGVDLAARSAATIGGMIATNAGGLRVLRHGSMREQVRGVEAVLADGTVVSRLAGLPKDSTGYDLVRLLAGSEGTLAVVTAACLRLTALPAARAVALVGVGGVAPAAEVLAACRATAPVSAAELFLADGLDLVRAHAGLPPPLAEPCPAYVLVEAAADADPTDALLTALSGCPAVRDATVAADPPGRARLWSYRELHTEAVGRAGVPVKLDVAVPAPRLADFVAALPAAVGAAAPGARTVVFGHLAEANLHVNVLDAVDRADAVTEAVLGEVAARCGSVSSEHGIGRAKARWLGLSRSPAEIRLMRGVRQAFDPAGMLNPGVLFDA
ncbi:MAG TPA: FAD-binding oxidoreductase [Pilimelia sp.]|nr:FAD-binding oxidoreductase [Pilimelia sp.]